MLTRENLDALRADIPSDPDRTRLLSTLRGRAAPLLKALPPIPRTKALLSRDGGTCPKDGAPLRFDPWSPERHACSRCGETFTGERHFRNWARPQHLWLAERTAELAILRVVADVEPAGDRALELVKVYEDLYFELPSRDNVLGPSHLFFSTYLESLWITSYLGGAFLLREAGVLTEERQEGVNRVADEAATIIGEFNEGLSNRQTWHAAALIAIAVWFGDEELARNTVESRTGLVGHLADGFGNDGLWWEGENYHLFALRGLMQGMHWARAAGYDLLEDSDVRNHFQAALMAPTRSALPDFTFPARRDSRFGVSLAQPAYLELWEIGRAWLGGGGEVEELDAWLNALYSVPAPPVEHYDAWLHDAGRPNPARRSRGDLSWWALTAMGAPLPETAAWNPESVLLSDQGLAVLRVADCYASLECGPVVGGHGHPDRLNLTLHAGGVHWLPDFGTGSYVVPALAWYRSAMAHNAPSLDGLNAGDADAWCEAFDAGEDVAWCRGRAGEVRRTMVTAPAHLLDILDVQAGDPRRLDLPWHFMGDWEITSPGKWEPATLDHPFVSGAERFVPEGGGPLQVEARSWESEASLHAWILADDAEVLRAVAPGLPTTDEPQPFLWLRATTGVARWVTVLDWAPAESDAAVVGARVGGGLVEIRTSRGPVRYYLTDSGLSVERSAVRSSLAGLRPAPAKHRRLFEERPVQGAEAVATRITDTPALDGSLDGFDTSEPLLLDDEQQYRRSEEPYHPERFSARAYVNWDGSTLYLAVSVSKPDLVFRAADAASLELDNESEDINSDGLQVYLRFDEIAAGVLVVPQEGGGLHIRSIEGIGAGQLAVRGRWARTEEGYCVTLRLDDPRIAVLHHGVRLGFDLLINQMQPDRTRRAGQLVWSGGNGWIYLRGDRQDPSEFGTLELG